MRNFSNQSVFVVIFKIDEKDLMILLLLSFNLSGRKICKYIAKALLFSMLSTKIIIFSMLSMLPIFGNIRKLRSSKSELVIKATVYVIFGQSKSLQYRYTRVLRFSIFQIYSSIFRVIVAKTAMIRIFRNTNQKISILLNFLQNFFQPHIK